jgi:hypothetical protein
LSGSLFYTRFQGPNKGSRRASFLKRVTGPWDLIFYLFMMLYVGTCIFSLIDYMISIDFEKREPSIAFPLHLSNGCRGHKFQNLYTRQCSTFKTKNEANIFFLDHAQVFPPKSGMENDLLLGRNI